MKSLEFFKPTLAATLAIVLSWLLSVRPAQAGYTVTLRQVGPDVVATGSGAIDLTAGGIVTGLGSFTLTAGITPRFGLGAGLSIVTGPTTTTMVDAYWADLKGPTSFGGGRQTLASSGSGDMVGIIMHPTGNPANLVKILTEYIAEERQAPKSSPKGQ